MFSYTLAGAIYRDPKKTCASLRQPLCCGRRGSVTSLPDPATCSESWLSPLSSRIRCRLRRRGHQNGGRRAGQHDGENQCQCRKYSHNRTLPEVVRMPQTPPSSKSMYVCMWAGTQSEAPDPPRIGANQCTRPARLTRKRASWPRTGCQEGSEPLPPSLQHHRR